LFIITQYSLSADPLPTGRQAVPTVGGAGRHYSNIPLFHYSTVPFFRHSNTYYEKKSTGRIHEEAYLKRKELVDFIS
jgi:hypothetical protein